MTVTEILEAMRKQRCFTCKRFKLPANSKICWACCALNKFYYECATQKTIHKRIKEMEQK